MHEATPAARRIGAVNTIVVDAGGSLIGSNTDAFGFIESVREAIPGWRADRGPAVVLGAGGAARAIVFALRRCRACRKSAWSTGRPVARDALAADLRRSGPSRCRGPTASAALTGAALLVNTTTLGMRHQPPLDLDLAALPTDAVVCDIVYAPLETPLLAAATARGNPVVDGLGMLLHQARPGFAAWFGQMPEVMPGLRERLLAGCRAGMIDPRA